MKKRFFGCLIGIIVCMLPIKATKNTSPETAKKRTEQDSPQQQKRTFFFMGHEPSIIELPPAKEIKSNERLIPTTVFKISLPQSPKSNKK